MRSQTGEPKQALVIDGPLARGWNAHPSQRGRESGGIDYDDGEVRWWTFGGGRINATLRYVLEAVGGDFSVTPDNFVVKVRGEDLDERRFREKLDRLRDPALWQDEKLWLDIRSTLPNYRLSKFQPLMPSWVEREVVASYLLDVKGAQAVCAGLTSG